MKLVNLSSLSILILFSLSMTSCGMNEEHIRDYRFYVHTDNELLLKTTEALVEDFNTCANRKDLFKITRDKTEYNSSIIYDANVKRYGEESTVGYGTFLRKASEENPLNVLKGSKPTIYYTYTGEIRLDINYVLPHVIANPNIDKNTDDYITMKKLFFHEAGHVIGLGHTPHRSDVMYPKIDGDKDYDAFCKLIQKHLSENP